MGPIKRVFQMCSYVRGPISCNWELFEGWLPISVSSITWFLEVSSFWIILNDSVWFQILFRTNGYPPSTIFFPNLVSIAVAISVEQIAMLKAYDATEIFCAGLTPDNHVTTNPRDQIYLKCFCLILKSKGGLSVIPMCVKIPNLIRSDLQSVTPW